MMDQDTICAVSTPPGEGGIGIVRMSGRDAANIASKLFRPRQGGDFNVSGSHTMRYGHVIDPDTGEIVDEVLVSIMRGPASYTREDVVEINCHGGMMPLRRTVELLLRSGARQAEPGEFTKRAFLNGRIDLAQAEAVMAVITARTERSLRAANEQLQGRLSREVAAMRDRLVSLVAAVEMGIDFPEEDIVTPSGRTIVDEVLQTIDGVDRLLSGFRHGRILREGLATAIVGRPNVGKSSLLNALLGQDRAIVAEVPGTTRDVIEEYLNVAGVPLRIVDTAGIRETHDMVEQEGVRRSLEAIRNADVVLVVLDGSERLHDGDRRVLQEVGDKTAIAVINKSDRHRNLEEIDRPKKQVMLSCLTGTGIDDLRKSLSDMVNEGTVAAGEHAWAVNQRHKAALEQARESLGKALESSRGGMSPELIALDLRDGLDSLGAVIGATYTEDILERIFRDFCVGK
jgi:tRNA modification GTPase